MPEKSTLESDRKREEHEEMLIREMKIKTTIPIRTAIIKKTKIISTSENVEKRSPFCNVSIYINLYSHCEKYGVSSKKQTHTKRTTL